MAVMKPATCTKCAHAERGRQNRITRLSRHQGQMWQRGAGKFKVDPVAMEVGVEAAERESPAAPKKEEYSGTPSREETPDTGRERADQRGPAGNSEQRGRQQ